MLPNLDTNKIIFINNFICIYKLETGGLVGRPLSFPTMHCYYVVLVVASLV